MTMSGVRSFVAVPLPPGAQGAIFAAAQSLAARLPPEVRWSRKAGNLHVTLRFLGSISPELQARYADELSGALATLPGFQIGLRGFGAFPSAGQASVIWAGVEDLSGSLGRVAAAVEQVAERLGFDPAEQEKARSRSFRAHVTVGRAARRAARSGVDAAAALGPWGQHGFGEIWVSKVHLYESILGEDGSTYLLRGTATLKGTTDGDVRQDREQEN